MNIRDANSVKDHLKNLAIIGPPPDPISHEPTQMSRGHCGAITNTLNKYLNGDLNRRLVLAWLFDYKDADLSSKLLDNDKWWALSQWINAAKDAESGEWLVDTRFPAEAEIVLVAAIDHYHANGSLMAAAVELGGEIKPIPYDQEIPVVKPTGRAELDYEF